VAYLLARKAGELYVGQCSVPAELPQEIRQKAITLARSLVKE
jgi:hypothetical protein